MAISMAIVGDELYFGVGTDSLLKYNTKGHCHPRASSAKTRGFHTPSSFPPPPFSLCLREN